MSWSKIDKSTWMDAGPPMLRVRSVGAGANIRFGAYRGPRYLGSESSLEAAQQRARKGALPPLPETVAPPRPSPEPESKSAVSGKSKSIAGSDGDLIRVLVQRNPFKAKSKVFEEFALLMLSDGRTVQEYLSGGGSKSRLNDEIRRGYVSRGAPPASADTARVGGVPQGNAASERSTKNGTYARRNRNDSGK